jgi:SAM-dependent methyltransferase
MEHIFDVPQVLRNIHAALKPGGRVFHMSPTSNQVDHGFYSFSPTFFADYYETNRWRLERLRLIRFRLDWLHSRPTVHDYTPTDQLHLLGSSHCYGSEAIATWCVARKLTESTCDRIPTQMVYRKGAWTGSKPPVDPWNLGSVNLVKRLAKSLLPQGPYETARAALVRYVWGRRQLLRVLKSSRVRRK